MDFTLIATFLDLASTGSFSRTAERVHITQSAVSARIKTLEQSLGCRLFDRDHNGAILTEPGQRFLSYANSINRLWLQGRQEAARAADVAAQISAGVHACLWDRLSLPWMDKVRERNPAVRIRLETAYSEYLSKFVEDGTLDFAVVYAPQALPGLEIEKLFEDKLVMVSTTPGSTASSVVDHYVHIDWGYGYRQRHAALLPHLSAPNITIGNPDVAQAFLADHGGAAYFPLTDVEEKLTDGRLFAVEEAPQINRPCYLTYPERSDRAELLSEGLDAMRAIVPQPVFST